MHQIFTSIQADTQNSATQPTKRNDYRYLHHDDTCVQSLLVMRHTACNYDQVPTVCISAWCKREDMVTGVQRESVLYTLGEQLLKNLVQQSSGLQL